MIARCATACRFASPEQRRLSYLASPSLRLMFDCYHVGRSGGDIISQLQEFSPLIGHIQFAAIPDRGPPDTGTEDFGKVFAAIDEIGWTRPLGAEYLPVGAVEDSLRWMEWRN